MPGAQLEEALRIEVDIHNCSIAIFAEGQAVTPQGSWPEAVIRVNLCPIRARAFAAALRAAAHAVVDEQ